MTDVSTARVIKLEPKVGTNPKAKKVYGIRPMIVLCSIVFITICSFFLLSQSNTMSDNKKVISSIEGEIASLKEQNDLKEMALKSEVDIQDVLRVATNELGMKKLDFSQIKTFKSSQKDSFKVYGKIK